MADLVRSDERHISLSGNPTIGYMRNAGCSAARGEIIAHFDDDDFSAPGRLADQIARLQQPGVTVTGYRSMRFTDGHDWWRYEGPRDYALGTSLCYRRDWWLAHQFPELQVGEDNGFVATARAGRKLAAADAGEYMWATIHGANTSKRNIKPPQWVKLSS